MKYIKDLPQSIQGLLLELFYAQMEELEIDGAIHKNDFLNSKVTDIDSLHDYVLELTGGW